MSHDLCVVQQFVNPDPLIRLVCKIKQSGSVGYSVSAVAESSIAPANPEKDSAKHLVAMIKAASQPFMSQVQHPVDPPLPGNSFKGVDDPALTDLRDIDAGIQACAIPWCGPVPAGKETPSGIPVAVRNRTLRPKHGSPETGLGQSPPNKFAGVEVVKAGRVQGRNPHRTPDQLRDVFAPVVNPAKDGLQRVDGR